MTDEFSNDDYTMHNTPTLHHAAVAIANELRWLRKSLHDQEGTTPGDLLEEIGSAVAALQPMQEREAIHTPWRQNAPTG